MLTLVVARARNGAIGKGNEIPWHAPEDLAAFQRETTGGAVIMGRRTWESLPFKPLKNRLNIVVTRDAALCDHTAPSPEAAIATARAAGYARLYGIGGEAIYRAMLTLADRLLVTEVDLAIPDADAFFPAFDEGEWRVIYEHRLRESGPGCVLREWIRG
ncbi:dihydrofolate reductase [Paragemmobacter straminiformis]|uniref:Dihydrofolate reductase n=1 Tax=Paragemmobacter straminiformis TaxID=2045119 RepID=A0A842I4B1_9RHOB|nr:dihydrofolate reductase [Gemmobacter straminiformis]MBC2833984.1 dihydrofolate reductase [Gemmobacter straminiformis]